MRKSLIGETYGKLTVIEEAKDSPKRKYQRCWLCKCDCGNYTIVTTCDLHSGNTQSCGCQKNKPKHGMAGTRIYRIYQCMKQRCKNPKNTNYKSYGGRGITVCVEWDKSFESFYNWALSNGYSDNKELDRINVNGNYSPDNCRWISHLEQCSNRRANVFVTIEDETHTLSEWARKVNIDPRTIQGRYQKGIRGQELISPPKRKKK